MIAAKNRRSERAGSARWVDVWLLALQEPVMSLKAREADLLFSKIGKLLVLKVMQ